MDNLLRVLINEVYNQPIDKEEQFHLQAIMTEVEELNHDTNPLNYINDEDKIKWQPWLLKL